MIEIPEDPIDVIIHRTKRFLHRFALSLMDDSAIINLGNMSNHYQPNRTVKSALEYESLDSEPDPNTLRGIARQLRLLQRSTHERFLPTVVFQELRHMKRAR